MRFKALGGFILVAMTLFLIFVYVFEDRTVTDDEEDIPYGYIRANEELPSK